MMAPFFLAGFGDCKVFINPPDLSVVSPKQAAGMLFILANAMNYPAAQAASILCVGMGWFPLTPGGLNRYLYELILQLQATHQDHIELCGVGLPSTSSNAAIHFRNLASPENCLPQRLWSVYQEFSRRTLGRPDVINLHFALYSLPILNQLPQDVPVIFNFHGPWSLESQWEGESKASVWFKRWVEQQVYQRCDRFIVLSKAFATILHETYQVPWEKIHIIPGGVNTQCFQPHLSRQAAREQLGWPQDRQILFTPRRLVHRMGVDQLLLALSQMKHQVPDVWLAIAGKGALRETLERQAIDLGLQNWVKFLGYVPDQHLPIAYQAADLTVVPSQSLEGFGLILTESLACGTPALCTPVGGMPEVMLPFCPDLVTASSDASALSDRLQAFLTGQIPLPSREACRQYAVDCFDWRTVSQQVRQVFLNSTH